MKVILLKKKVILNIYFLIASIVNSWLNVSFGKTDFSLLFLARHLCFSDRQDVLLGLYEFTSGFHDALVNLALFDGMLSSLKLYATSPFRKWCP